jgi:DNA-binding transcriptional MerR regulator
MRIGELARRTGASARSLRYYEQQGLVHSTRSVGGQRLYTASEVARVEMIRRLFDAGLGSKVIARLLPCRSRNSWTSAAPKARYPNAVLIAGASCTVLSGGRFEDDATLFHDTDVKFQ